LSDLDFYARAATGGTVFGLGIGATPEQVAERLGPDFLDDRQRGMFRRDYGLLEFAFYRHPSWACQAIGIQVHRLLTEGADAVPPPLRGEFGEFSRRVKISGLESAIKGLGSGLDEETGSASADFSRWRVRDSGVEIIVVGPSVAVADRPEDHEFGDVWSILLPGSAPSEGR
jgi:hypothetical protein